MMYRLYLGSIEGKPWIEVLSSDESERYRDIGRESDCKTFDFSGNQLQMIEEDINDIESKLGGKTQILDYYVKEKVLNKDLQISDMGIDITELYEYTYLLMIKVIRNCIIEESPC